MSLIARSLAVALLAGLPITGFAQAVEPACRALDAAATRAAEALATRVSADGQLQYLESATGERLPGYNVVRHAGVLYALADLDSGEITPEIAAARDRASRYLEACCLRPVALAPDAYAVWSDAEGHPEYAKLGASGLALAAWAALFERGAASPPLDQLRGLGRFLLAMQDENGLFYMRYHARDGRLRRTSLYYPGEAALGLIRLARLDPSGPWLSGADRAIAALAQARRLSGDYPPDHWLLIAGASHEASGALPGWRTPLVDALLAEANPKTGALTHDARVAPTAARLEGLAGALARSGDAAARQRIRQALTRGSAWLLAQQRADGAFARGGRSARAREHRIDITQHALSALRHARAAGACAAD